MDTVSMISKKNFKIWLVRPQDNLKISSFCVASDCRLYTLTFSTLPQSFLKESRDGGRISGSYLYMLFFCAW